MEDIDREEEQSLDIIEQHLASNAKKRKEASSSKKEREQKERDDAKTRDKKDRIVSSSRALQKNIGPKMPFKCSNIHKI